MKRFISIIILTMGFMASVSAYDFSAVSPSGHTLYYTISNGGVVVTYPQYTNGNDVYGSYPKPTGALVIPDSVTYNGTTYAVTSIGQAAFYWCDSLTSVTIGNRVVSVSRLAFYRCTNLTSVSIGTGVTVIDYYAFGLCSNLSSIAIPDNVATIGEFAFSGCELHFLTLGNGVTTIGSGAFSSSLLRTLSIPASVISIGRRAFTAFGDYNSGVSTSIAVASGNTVYDSRGNCNAIIETATNRLILGCETTVIPSTVTSIAPYAFNGSQITSLPAIPSSITIIDTAVFLNCPSLSNVVIPNHITSIGPGAFQQCYLLSSLHIGRAVSNIAAGTFSMSNERLSSITVDSLNTVYDSRNNCNAIIYSSTDSLVLACANTTIPTGITHIAPWAFEGLNISSISIPNTVVSIGQGAFSQCILLDSVVIPSSVTSLEPSLFSGCTGLTNIVISSSVTTIGARAFYGCAGLTSVSIPSSVTTIGGMAFCNSGLGSVSIPSSVTSIGESAFNDCSGLTSISVNVANPVYDSRCNCNALIETATNTLLTGCRNTIIPEGITTLGTAAFSECTYLTTITLPQSLTAIGIRAFNCDDRGSMLASITSLAIVPPALDPTDDRPFGGIADTIPIYVPQGTAAAYATAWPYFHNFIETQPNYAVTVSSSDSTLGRVYCERGCGNTTATLYAIPEFGCNFLHWNDSNTTNPRTVTLTADTTFIAYFSIHTVSPVHDTIYIRDTVYDTVYVGIYDAEEASNVLLYSNGSQIVVEGASGMPVRLYDGVGRLIATKEDVGSYLCFDVPVTGTYLVRIGNLAARRIVVIR